MRPQSYASSTTGVKKSVVDRIATSPDRRTAAASSPWSRPTSSSGSAGPVPSRSRTMSSSSPGGILHAHPPPCAYWVSRIAVVVMMASLARYTLYSEAYVFLVDAAVFKTDVARYPGQAGSIPVRLRQSSPRDVADACARHRRSCRPWQVHARPRADRHRARPAGPGAPPRHDPRPGFRVDHAAPRRAPLAGFRVPPAATGETVAFVDVQGHERFVGTMLAGVAPVPGVVVVV